MASYISHQTVTVSKKLALMGLFLEVSLDVNVLFDIKGNRPVTNPLSLSRSRSSSHALARKLLFETTLNELCFPIGTTSATSAAVPKLPEKNGAIWKIS